VAGDYFHGYAAEIVHVNAQQLTPSSFGSTDTTTGSWKPKAYSSTYGTNGFWLKFADSAALGTDSSGNGNTWTKTGTVTQTTDSPTDSTASNVGNYCVLNPLDFYTTPTLTQGNLHSGASGRVRGTVASMQPT
jgi:hypothetical protein